MPRHVYRLAFLICGALMTKQSAVDAATADPCADPGKVVNAAMTLESTRLDQNGMFNGIFRIENLRQGVSVYVSGLQGDGLIRVVHPERSIEYLDEIANEWRPVLDIPGSFPPRTSRLAVAPGKDARISVSLVSKDLASRGARMFRVLLRTSEPRLCFTSVPFRAYPVATEVEGFKAAPREQ